MRQMANKRLSLMSLLLGPLDPRLSLVGLTDVLQSKQSCSLSTQELSLGGILDLGVDYILGSLMIFPILPLPSRTMNFYLSQWIFSLLSIYIPVERLFSFLLVYMSLLFLCRITEIRWLFEQVFHEKITTSNAGYRVHYIVHLIKSLFLIL